MRTGRLLLAAAAALAGATLWLAHSLDSEAHVEARLAWPVGARYDYQLAWTSDSAVNAGEGGSFASKLDLAATLRLVGAGRADEGWLVAASFVAVERSDVELLGQRVFADADAARSQLVGPTAWVVVDDAGKVVRVHVDANAPQVFKHLMQTVVGLASVTVSSDPSWTAKEPGPSGIARVAYRREGAAWSRDRIAYDSLTAAPAIAGTSTELAARALITVDPGLHVTTLVDDESIVVRSPGSAKPLLESTSKFSLTRTAASNDAPRAVPSLASLETREPGVAAQAGDVYVALRQQAAAGMTREELLGGLARPWGTSSEQRKWFHRAVAMLQLHPELIADVEDTFLAGDKTTKLFAFDLLASAGTVQAQKAMRELLAAPSPLDVELVQRFSFVTRPDAETTRFVRAAWQAARAGENRELASATTYATGALARRLGSSETAAEINADLRDALAKARTDRDREDALAGLGNTGNADNVTAIRAHASDDSPQVRSRAAWALRDMATADARETLHEMVGDEDPRVARSALHAMQRQTLDANDWSRLESAASGPLAEATWSALIDLVGLQLQTGGATAHRILESIAARTTDTKLQARARVLLAQTN